MDIALHKESVAIYCRLSREDGQEESSSISSQKELLQEFCAKHNYFIYKIYIDDGYTGTNFDRPSFQELIKDIKDKKVNVVITKDLSRLGRNYILTGYYTDYFFPENDVRYIALNDNIDTKTQDNSNLEFAPFKNVINEWYAKDISKKVRATINLKQTRGDIFKTGKPIYGYKYDQTGKVIEIDEETAPNVIFIFNEFAKGTPITRICKKLYENKQYAPGYYYYLKYGFRKEKYLNINEEQKYIWSESSIKRILSYKEYLGYLVTNKSAKVSFKIKKIVAIPEDQRNYFENKRPQIISNELFDLVQNRKNTKVKIKETSKLSSLYGVLRCQCGHCLTYREEEKYERKKRNPYYFCYVKKDKKKEYHLSIPEDTINKLIKIELEKVKAIIQMFHQDILDYASNYSANNNKDNQDTIKDKLDTLEKEAKKLDYQIEKLFEEHLNDNIPSSTYQAMMKRYTAKKDDIEKEILDLKGKLTPQIEKKIDYVKVAKNFIEQIQNLDLSMPLMKETLNFIFKFIVISKVNIKSKHDYDYEIEYNYCLPERIIKQYEAIFNKQ